MICGSSWKEAIEYKPYDDHIVPFLIFGDFYWSRREEQNKYLLDVSLLVSYFFLCLLLKL